MAADVVETAELAVLAANDENALADDVDREEVAGLGRVVGAPRVEPLAEEDLLPLQVEHVRRVVVASGEGWATGGRSRRGRVGRPALVMANMYPQAPFDRRASLDTWCAVGLHCAIIPSQEGGPLHPRERPTTRRQFLIRAGTVVGTLAGADLLLSAC